MKKFFFRIFRLKEYIFPFFIFLFVICLILFSSSNIEAAKKGLNLWASSVLPSLFPFFVATELLSKTELPHLFGKIFNKFMKPCFNIRGEGSFALIMGWLSGYPVGAKIAANFRKENICSKTECERILSFTNNSGPLFIVGTVGISMFGNSSIGLLLLITHILGCLTVGFIFRFWHRKQNNINKSFINKSNRSIIQLPNFGEILSSSIANSISTILSIGGFVVLFSVIISILQHSKVIIPIINLISFIFDFCGIEKAFAEPLFFGILEITNGIFSISNIHIKAISINIILTAFLLGFGGLSILMQVLSITSKTDLSIKPYIYGKILHGVFSAFYTFLLINLIPFFNFNL